MLKTRVKASRVTNLTDARYFAAWEVDWIGFSLDASSDYHVSPNDLMAIREWLTGPKIVGEFGMTDPETIQEAATFLKLDAVQLSGFDIPVTAEKISGIPVIAEIVIDRETTPDWVAGQCNDLSSFCESIILEFSKNDISWEDLVSGNNFHVHQLKALCEQHPVLLSIICPASDIEEMMAEVKPHGLNLFGGEEEKTGVKSFEEIDEIFEILYREG